LVLLRTLVIVLDLSFFLLSKTAGTTIDELYWTNQYGTDFTYDIMVPAVQNYEIKLHMAELFWDNAGQRVFDVELEGMPWLSSYDIVDSTGGRYVAETISTTNMIEDGSVTIRFIARLDNAQISGIEVIAA
jgi:hypothetical protein